MPDPTDEGKTHFISPRLLKKLDYQTPISKFYTQATYMSRRIEPESLDFTLGDAHEMPPALPAGVCLANREMPADQAS